MEVRTLNPYHSRPHVSILVVMAASESNRSPTRSSFRPSLLLHMWYGKYVRYRLHGVPSERILVFSI